MRYKVNLEKIARLRKVNGYTQEQFATELRITQSYYSQKELGLKRFKPEEILIISKLLGEECEGLFEACGEGGDKRAGGNIRPSKGGNAPGQRRNKCI